MFTEYALGITAFDNKRQERMPFSDAAMKDKYIARITSFVENGQLDSILREDMATLMLIAETEDHLKLIETIASKKDPDIGNWGSGIARLYYKMGLVDRALKNVKDVETFGEFFNQKTSYKIVMTMLFNAGRYQDVVDLHQFAIERLPDGNIFPILALAAYAKINSPEALARAEEIYSKESEREDDRPIGRSRRDLMLLCYLAVNNGKSKLAVNLITGSPSRFSFPLRELKIAALVHLKRYEEILIQVRDSISRVRRPLKVMTRVTHSMISDHLNEVEDEETREQLAGILKDLTENDSLDDRTLEDLVFAPLGVPPTQVHSYEGSDSGQLNEMDSRPRFARNQTSYDQYSRPGSYSRRYNNQRDGGYDTRGSRHNDRGDSFDSLGDENQMEDSSFRGRDSYNRRDGFSRRGGYNRDGGQYDSRNQNRRRDQVAKSLFEENVQNDDTDQPDFDTDWRSRRQ